MTETPVIRHYKKLLIHRQHNVSANNIKSTFQFLNEVSNTKIYDIVEGEKIKNKNEVLNGKKVRKKRKNKNCRGQFRHEAMELIKLGTNNSHCFRKTKEPLTTRIDKLQSTEPITAKNDRNVPQNKSECKKTTNETPSVIQSKSKTILEKSQPQPHFGHSLPQMVPERRNSKEIPTKISAQVPVIYHTPPSTTPDYRVPIHPTHPFSPQISFSTVPPTFPKAHSPPRSVPRSPIRPIPQSFQNNPLMFKRKKEFNNDLYHHESSSNVSEMNKKRKTEEKVKDSYPVVAAIDLTVDNDKVTHHKCKCECGKTYNSDSVTQEVIITVKESNSKVSSQLELRGKMVDGVLKFDQTEPKKSLPELNSNNKVPAPISSEMKLPPLFLIEDLLAKKKSRQNNEKEKNINPIRKQSNQNIVNQKTTQPTKSKDYSVQRIIGDDDRRQSVDIDTMSICSSSSESVKSPRPKSNNIKKQIPHGKLYYYINNNSFIRYFDETQKKIFIDNLTSDGHEIDNFFPEDKEVIELPSHIIFNSKDNLTVEEYVSEMTLVENYIPQDFFQFYKFVTGYQICNNNLPVSFLTFLKVYNTNGLKILLERYVSSLNQN